MDYRSSGVDLEKEGTAISKLTEILNLGINKGRYAGTIQFGEDYLVLTTDGVGSKIELCRTLKKFDTIGIDCVAMNVNDLICLGAEPLAFVDYISMPEIDCGIIEEIGKGLAEGAKIAGVEVVGGELATLANSNTIELVGCCCGIAKGDRLIDGSAISEGDEIIGIPSSGIHSNGLTLARRSLDESFYQILLEPTRIYVEEVLKALEDYGREIHGLAHITGYGLLNLLRLNKNFEYYIDRFPEPMKIFEDIRNSGGISYEEMFRVFNMGIGFILIANSEISEELARDLDGKIIGEIRKGQGVKLEYP